jgi:hypothetical protein
MRSINRVVVDEGKLYVLSVVDIQLAMQRHATIPGNEVHDTLPHGGGGAIRVTVDA